MKTLILIFSMLVSLSSCNDDNTSGQETSIIGTWKLIKIEYVWLKRDVIDYCDDNITYTFEPNGVLKVDGDPNVNYPSGTYKYEFGKFSLSSLESNPKILIVKIDGSKWAYSLNDGIMKLGMSYIDGSDLYFKRK